MVIFGIFPGQGSQIVGMGKEFADQYPKAQELFCRADQVLGLSLSSLCLDGPIEKLTLTEFAQPAILLVSYIAYTLSGIRLSAGAGHSLGEYSAYVAAKAISFEDAIQLVHRRGKYMQEAVAPGEGKMVAVMGPAEEEIRKVLAEVKGGVVEIANLNTPGQTVIAGDASSVDEFSSAMQKTGAKIIPLQVSAPFHCRLMEPAAQKLRADLDAVSFADPEFPIYSNVTAEPVTSGQTARELLKRQVCGTVRWAESVTRALADTKASYTVEFGSGDVLSKMMKRIEPKVSRLSINSPETLKASVSAFAG